MSCQRCQLIVTDEAPYLETYFEVYVTQGRPPLPPTRNLILNGPRQYVTPPVTPPPPPPPPPRDPNTPEIPGPPSDEPGTPNGDPNDNAPTGPNTGGNTSNPGGPPPPPDTPNNPDNREPEVRDFGNVPVFFNNCTAGTSMQFTGSTPQWIMFNGTSLEGREGTFRGETQELADEAAQDAIDEFAAAAIANGELTCATSVCPTLFASYPAFANARACVYVSSTDRIWVSRNTGGVNIVDPASGAFANVPTAGVATEELVHASTPNRVFASIYTGFQYDVHDLDPVTGADLGSLLTSEFLMPLYNATKNHICTSTAGGYKFYNATSLVHQFTLVVPGNHLPAYCPTTDKYYIGEDGVGIHVFNGVTGALETTIVSGSTFYGGTYAPGVDRVIILENDGFTANVLMINPNTNTVTDTIAIPLDPWDGRFCCFIDPVSELVYIACQSATVEVFDPVSATSLCQISGPSFVLNVGFASSNSTIWIPFGVGGANAYQ